MKRQPKFKVGDKVRVLRASTNAEYDFWMYLWEPSMNEAIGKVMTIVCITHDTGRWGDNLYPKYRFSYTGLNFPEFVLQIKVGQQLLFSFMD